MVRLRAIIRFQKMASTTSSTEAEEYLHREIPLTRAMGVRVLAHEECFAVEAPVALNSNHLGTGFGGSIHSIATIAGYLFLWDQVRDQRAHLVIGESTIRFLRPVRETIRAICSMPAAGDLGAFKSTLRSEGTARLPLEVRVEEDGLVAAQFRATFVGTTQPAE